MPKRVAGSRRGGSKALEPHKPVAATLLDRILDTPHLAQVVPQLQPGVLHRVVQTLGLEDSGEIVALATPGQLAAVFDLDLWRSDNLGLDEQFDAERFGVWLEVLVEAGAVSCAKTLAGIDVQLFSGALAQHVRVFDVAAEVPKSRDAVRFEIGSYEVVATNTRAWDAIVAALTALRAEQPAYFHSVMRGCRSVSDSDAEVDGLDNLLDARGQILFDMAASRARRREEQGYVSSADARAFLQMSRQIVAPVNAKPLANPLAAAYFHGVDSTISEAPSEGAGSPEDLAAVVEVLVDAGVIPRPPLALLEGAQEDAAPHLARMRSLMRFASADPAAYSARTQELAYLVNVMAAGCSVQTRPLTVDEASEAAIAVCNLGLENWPEAPLPDGFLIDHDLVAVFQCGWQTLYQRVVMFTAKALTPVLAGLRCEDADTRAGVAALRRDLKKYLRAGEPWQTRERLEVLASLDMTALAALLGLIDHFPVIHAGLRASIDPRARAVSATAFEFIAENSQIADVHEFMRRLPDVLRA